MDYGNSYLSRLDIRTLLRDSPAPLGQHGPFQSGRAILSAVEQLPAGPRSVIPGPGVLPLPGPSFYFEDRRSARI
jgi:hypothetical protein